MARAKLQRGPDLLRLDDELLVDLGITFKLQRRAMLESLNQFRGDCDAGSRLEEKSSVKGSFRKAWDRVSAHRDLDNAKQHAWERVSTLHHHTDEEGVATFYVDTVAAGAYKRETRGDDAL